MEIRERGIWRGEVVTILSRSASGVEIRDGFGFTHSVRKRDVKPLAADDERAKFVVKGENE